VQLTRKTVTEMGGYVVSGRFGKGECTFCRNENNIWLRLGGGGTQVAGLLSDDKTRLQRETFQKFETKPEKKKAISDILKKRNKSGGDDGGTNKSITEVTLEGGGP